MNKDAGRGNWLIVTLRLENGETLPFMMDTGCPITKLDKSLEPKLGKCLGTTTAWAFGVKNEVGIYAAPKLYLRNTPLMTYTNFILTEDCKRFSSSEGRSTMGVLGMDVLEHYCIQLDFNRGVMHFLDDEHANKIDWGKPFPLIDVGERCFIVGENLVGAKGPGSLIDTGWNGDGLLTPELFQQWTNHALLPASGEARSPNGMLGGATYHSLDLRGLDKNDHDSHSGFNTIGIHVLSQNLVTFDFQTRTMYLKRTSDWPLYDKRLEAAAKSDAGPVLKSFQSLRKKGQLPGWSKNDKSSNKTAIFSGHYADVGTCHVAIQKKGDSSFYYYTFVRTSKESPWKLQKAWRTDQNDRTVEEYPVP